MRIGSSTAPGTKRSTEALDAAGIPVERRGRARLTRLSEPERSLYLWILQRFAAASPPAAEATRAAANLVIDGARTVQAMCAIDALGIAPMLDQPVEISSRDPLSDGAIRVRLDPDGRSAGSPTLRSCSRAPPLVRVRASAAAATC